MADGKVKALWIGDHGYKVVNGPELVPCETIVEIPAFEAEESPNWKPLETTPKGPTVKELHIAEIEELVPKFVSTKFGKHNFHVVDTDANGKFTNGKTQVLDGPYVETKEQLGGYFLIDVPDLDAALAWAARCPGASHGAVEVRPIWNM